MSVQNNTINPLKHCIESKAKVQFFLHKFLSFLTFRSVCSLPPALYLSSHIVRHTIYICMNRFVLIFCFVVLPTIMRQFISFRLFFICPLLLELKKKTEILNEYKQCFYVLRSCFLLLPVSLFICTIETNSLCANKHYVLVCGLPCKDFNHLFCFPWHDFWLFRATSGEYKLFFFFHLDHNKTCRFLQIFKIYVRSMQLLKYGNLFGFFCCSFSVLYKKKHFILCIE